MENVSSLTAQIVKFWDRLQTDFLTTDVYGDILNRNKKCLHVHMVGVKVLNSCDHLWMHISLCASKSCS
jgi:hypothetical protein